mgnify:CR=1 FL=1
MPEKCFFCGLEFRKGEIHELVDGKHFHTPTCADSYRTEQNGGEVKRCELCGQPLPRRGYAEETQKANLSSCLTDAQWILLRRLVAIVKSRESDG